MALRALSIAATGGRAMMDQVDTIANNLANVNTVAYKRTRANFRACYSKAVDDAVAQVDKPALLALHRGNGMKRKG